MMIIEILNSMGKVLARSRHQSFPIRIGRGYDENEVIIDDEFVSPHHMSIERDEGGHIRVVDCNSENGVFILPSRQLVTQASIQAEALFRIGHTTVRIRTSEYVVPPTRQDKEFPVRMLQAFQMPWFLAGIIMTTTVYLCVEVYWNTFSKSDIGEIVLGPMWAMVVLSIWAGCWALTSKTLVHYHYFKVHFGIACLALLGFSLFETFNEYYAFAFSAKISSEILFWVGNSLLLGMVLWGHLRFCSVTRSQTLAWQASLFVVAIMGILSLSWHVATTEFTQFMSYHGELKPPTFQISKPVTFEEFFGGLNQLKIQIDSSISEE